MTSVVQSIGTNGTGGGAAGTWLSTLGAGATAGNTLFLVVFDYSTSSTTITSANPRYNGSAYPAAVQLFSVLSPGSNNVYVSAWMFPNVPGGGTTLGADSNATVDGNVGSIAYEVAGLGATPTVDRLSTGSGISGVPPTTDSGATAATRFANEFVLGAGVAFGQNQAAASGFTNLWTNGASGFCEAGYQIATSSGGTYDYVGTGSQSVDWSAGIVTVYAPSSAFTGLLQQSPPIYQQRIR